MSFAAVEFAVVSGETDATQIISTCTKRCWVISFFFCHHRTSYYCHNGSVGGPSRRRCFPPELLGQVAKLVECNYQTELSRYHSPVSGSAASS